MKPTIRILALMLALVTVFTLIGCHQKDEVVLTVGDVEITSGLYIAFQLDGYGKLMEGVNSQLSASSAESEITKYADYFNYTYEDQTASDYINSQALAFAMEYALIQQKYEEYGLELTKDQTEYAEEYAKYYWENGEKEYYEPNGVGFESYKKLVIFRTMKSVIFEYYYGKKDEETGKGGLYTVADADLKKALGENYVLANTLTIDLVPSEDTGLTEYTDAQKEEFKKDLQDKIDQYNKGTAFDTIYKEVYGEEPQSNVQEYDDLKTIYPESAGVFSDESSDATLFSLLKDKKAADDFKYETAYLIGSEDAGQYSMAVIYDISKDPYYLEQYRLDLLYLLKDEEFTAKLAEEAKSLAVNKNQSLVDFYKPTNIDYDTVEENMQ